MMAQKFWSCDLRVILGVSYDISRRFADGSSHPASVRGVLIHSPCYAEDRARKDGRIRPRQGSGCLFRASLGIVMMMSLLFMVMMALMMVLIVMALIMVPMSNFKHLPLK